MCDVALASMVYEVRRLGGFFVSSPKIALYFGLGCGMLRAFPSCEFSVAGCI